MKLNLQKRFLCGLSITVGLGTLGIISPLQSAAQFNGYETNGLTMNGMTLNGLTMNGLTMNGLTMNGMTLNGMTLNGVKSNEQTLITQPISPFAHVVSSDSAAVQAIRLEGSQLVLDQ